MCIPLEEPRADVSFGPVSSYQVSPVLRPGALTGKRSQTVTGR